MIPKILRFFSLSNVGHSMQFSVGTMQGMAGQGMAGQGRAGQGRHSFMAAADSAVVLLELYVLWDLAATHS